MKKSVNGSVGEFLRSFAALALSVLCSSFSLNLQAASTPVCPDGAGTTNPALALVGDPPAVASWLDLSELPDTCHLELQSNAALTIALAGRFSHAGEIDDIAVRLGAISQTRGLAYWSVTDEDWRELVSDAFALNSSATDDARKDFSAQEMLSGETLYFAQNDTRSWGANVYDIKAVESSADHLVLASSNVSDIRLGPVRLFAPKEIHSVLFINQIDDATWSYFSLSVITHSSLAAREKSLINRQAAFYRLLIGQATDAEPPLAP